MRTLLERQPPDKETSLAWARECIEDDWRYLYGPNGYLSPDRERFIGDELVDRRGIMYVSTKATPRGWSRRGHGTEGMTSMQAQDTQPKRPVPPPPQQCALCGAFLPNRPNADGCRVCGRCGTEWEWPS